MPKRAISWAALLIALPGVALAADLPNRKALPPPPLMFSWDGLYIGSSFGYNFATMNEQALDPLPGAANGVPVSTLTGPGGYQQSYSPRGVLTDFHVGYLKQFGNFVAGGEFDVGFSPSNTAKTLTNGLSAVMPGGTASIAGIPQITIPGGVAPFQTAIQDNARISLLDRVVVDPEAPDDTRPECLHHHVGGVGECQQRIASGGGF